MMFNIEGKRAVITGGTSGIGYAVAKRYICAGVDVIICGRSDAVDMAREIGAKYLQVDVSCEEEMINLFKKSEDILGGKIDILINNAGIQDTGSSIEEHSISDFEKNVNILLKGVYLGLKYGPPHMNDGGCIINTSSIGALTTNYGAGQYCMAKAGVNSLTKTAAIELSVRGIRVNTISPGTVLTPMVDNEPEEIALSSMLSALGRCAEADELAGTYHFLASSEASYITGANLVVDGGFTAGISMGLLGKLMAEGEQEGK